MNVKFDQEIDKSFSACQNKNERIKHEVTLSTHDTL
jgi:hypothetical protein